MGIKDRLKNEKGLTLIEVLASVAILVIILGIGMAALTQSTTLTSKIQGESQDRQDMQVGLLELTNAVQSATDIKKGKDDYNFELIDSENRTIKYWLVDGQLNSDSKEGQTQVEGIEKMIIQEGKGITLEVEDLEEPVVLATRGGLLINTGLNKLEDTEPPTRPADIICMPGEFEYKSYPGFEEAVNSGNISCDTKIGKLSFNNGKSTVLSGGDLSIRTVTMFFDFKGELTLTNGNLYLVDNEEVQIKNHGKLIVSKGAFYPVSNISLANKSEIQVNKDLVGFNNFKVNESSESKITVGGKLTGNTLNLGTNNTLKVTGVTKLNQLDISNTGNKFIAENDVIVNGKANFFQILDTNITGSFHVRGNLRFDHSSETNFSVSNEIIIQGNAKLGQKFKHIGTGKLFIGGNLETEHESNISSDTAIVIMGDVKNGQSAKLASKKNIYVNGNYKGIQFSQVSAEEDLIIYGKATNEQGVTLNVRGSVYINGSLTNTQSSSFNILKDLVVMGDLSNERDIKSSIQGSLYINGFLKLSSENEMQIKKNLYVQNGLTIMDAAKLRVNEDSFINGNINLPTNYYYNGGAFFYTDKTLTYTGPIVGVEKDSSGFNVLKPEPRKKVASINNLPVFPKIPLIEKPMTN